MMRNIDEDPILAAELAKILKLREEERDHLAALAAVRAKLGEHFLRVKARHYEITGKRTGWLAWIRANAGYSDDSVNNFIDLHRLRKKMPNAFGVFSRRFECRELYFLAKQPDGILRRLARAKTVTVGGRKIPVEKLTLDQLRALIAEWKGEPPPRKNRLDDLRERIVEESKSLEWEEFAKELAPLFGVPRRRAPVEVGDPGPAKSKEVETRSIHADVVALIARVRTVRALAGDLSDDAKGDLVEDIEKFRVAALRLPADHRRP